MSETSSRKRLCIALAAYGILSVVGLVIAWELTDVYVRSRTDPDFQSFCAVSEGMNCETVALSEYSTVLSVPVSVWAAAGYAFVLFLSVFGLVRRADGFARGYMFLFSLAFSGVSAWLIYLMSAVIGSMCILCLALDVVNAGLLVMAVLAMRATQEGFGEVLKYDFSAIVKRPVLPAIAALAGAAVLAGGFVYGRHIAQASRAGESLSLPMEQQQLDSPPKWTSKTEGECGQECPCREKERDRTINMGVDANGHNWIGAPKGVLVIEEYTDYECPYCRKAHLILRKLLSNHPDRVKVVHRHFPLDKQCNPMIDRPFHKRACELSKIAVCAGAQGRFWEMNDFLFQHARDIREKNLSPADIAGRLELDMDSFNCCMADETQSAGLKGDIDAGIRLGLKGTPAFVVDGKVYYGKVPDEAVSRLEND